MIQIINQIKLLLYIIIYIFIDNNQYRYNYGRNIEFDVR